MEFPEWCAEQRQEQINQDRRGALCSHTIEIDLPDMTFDVPPFTPPPFDLPPVTPPPINMPPITPPAFELPPSTPQRHAPSLEPCASAVSLTRWGWLCSHATGV